MPKSIEKNYIKFFGACLKPIFEYRAIEHGRYKHQLLFLSMSFL
jgi:hypothetical protein